jgi:hypothetical protein
MRTKWELHQNTLGTYKSNTLTILQKKKSLSPWMHTASPYCLFDYVSPNCFKNIPPSPAPDGMPVVSTTFPEGEVMEEAVAKMVKKSRCEKLV